MYESFTDFTCLNPNTTPINPNPGVGLLGGAMELCAAALDPPVHLSHLKAESENLRKMLEDSSDLTREGLKAMMRDVEERIREAIH